jgi:xanthine/uracil permease
VTPPASPSAAAAPPDDPWERTAPAVVPVYRVDERPGRWWESLLYGWQHTLVDISPFVLPFAVAEAVAMPASESAALINYCLVAMGVGTLIQTTIGNRLPLIQGPSATLTGTLAPVAGQLGLGAMWGAAFAGGLLEAALGASRLLGRLRRFLPPAVAGAVVLTIALALGEVAVRLAVGDGRAGNFGLAALAVAAIALLQVGFGAALGGLSGRAAVFVTVWTVGLGVGALIGRVDWALIAAKPWVELPRLFPYGGPGFGWTLVPAAVLAVLAGYLGSVVESLGDYAALCSVAGERYRPRHMNRGIMAEGVACVAATLVGGLPVTSYTQNVGIVATTRVASRYVVQVAALILLLYGLSPKVGALLVAMPRPVLGGVFLVVCGAIALTGIRLIAGSREHPALPFIAGVTLLVAIGVPPYVRYALGERWLASLPVLARLTLTNSVVLAVLLGLALNAALGSASGKAHGGRSPAPRAG